MIIEVFKRILLVIASLGLILLLIFGVRKFNEIREETETIQECTSSEEETTSQVQESTEQTESESTTEPTSEPEEEVKRGYIIIGDSHTVVTDGQGYTALGSTLPDIKVKENLFFVHTYLDPVMGTYDWFANEGPVRIRQVIDENPSINKWSIISIHGTSMVIVPGVTELYIATYNQWIEDTFKDCEIYIVSIPPLDEEEWVVRHPDFPERHNKEVKEFNEIIKSNFPERYFDYYDWFIENGEFQDEIHYIGETYRNMFDEVIAKINEGSIGE